MSVLPAAVSNWTLFAFAASCAASFIFTKNGFVSRFVIRPTVTPLLARAVVAAAVAATGGDAEHHPQQPLPRVGAFRRAYDVPMHLLLVGPVPVAQPGEGLLRAIPPLKTPLPNRSGLSPEIDSRAAVA